MANLRANNLTGTGGRNALDGSVAFLGSKDALQVPAGSDFAYGTGDFTIETWIRPGGGASGTSKGIFCQTQSGNDYVKFFIESDKTIKATFGSDTITGGKVEVASWSHVAVTRASNTVKVFVNGVASSGTSVTTDFTDTTRKPTIGQYTHSFGTLEYYGYISNFHIVKGTALYTTDFTPSTEKLTAVDGTVLLCCQDSDNELQEATGKTITGYGNLDTTQTEKINGRFSGDPASNGWTVHSGASASYANGQWTVTSPSTIWKGATTSFTSIVGQQYRLTGIVVTSNNWGSISVSAVGGGSASKLVYSGWSGGGTFPLTVNKIFTATTTTTHVSIDNLNTTNNTVTTVQYVSVKPVEVGKAPKVFPPVGIDEGVVFEGDTKVNSQGYMYFPTGDTSQRGTGRALYAGGYKTPNTVKTIDYLSIQSGGLTQKFGDLSGTAQANCSACSSSTRMVTNGGWTGSANNNVMEYVTIAVNSNSTDFGDLAVPRRNNMAASNQTRGLVYGGNGTPANTAQVDYFEIATTGNAADFGDASSATAIIAAGASSSTRALFAGGYTPSAVDTIDYFTIASTGNYTDFGNLSSARKAPGGLSSSTRSVFGGGGMPSAVNTIDYVTTATTGNASDFGDLSLARAINDGTSNGTRGVWMGGTTSPARQDTIDSIEIATTGNAVNWGDFTVERQNGGASSDSHGGLS